MTQHSGTANYEPYTMRDVRRASSAARFTVATTFCGGGGSSTGHQLAGGNVVLANEFVREAARTYRANFPHCRLDTRDIRDITASRDSIEGFLAAAGLRSGELDLLDGSPPCCEFSVAGNGIAEEDVMRNYSDVKQRNIAMLPFDFIDLAHVALPKTVFIENVPGLTFAKSAHVFENILHALRFRKGVRQYFVSWSILSANDFGVAQNRRRVIILGIRADVANVIEIRSDDAVRELYPLPTSPGVNIRSAFMGLHQTSEELSPWLKAAMVSPLGMAMRLLPKCPPKPLRLRHVIPNYRKKFTLVRSSWDCPSTTLVVSGQRPDGMTGVIHPEQDRKFTLPEMKRLFGLPDDFILTGTLAQSAERVCRMVPPFLTKAVANNVYERVLRPYSESAK
jgi:DNA-cytosine methyltransferase